MTSLNSNDPGIVESPPSWGWVGTLVVTVLGGWLAGWLFFGLPTGLFFGVLWYGWLTWMGANLGIMAVRFVIQFWEKDRPRRERESRKRRGNG